MLLDRYLDHLRFEKRASPHTVAAYARDLGTFSAFAEALGVGRAEHADDQVVRAWMMELLEQGRSARTVQRKLSALRGFFRFARLTGDMGQDPGALIEPPKVPQRLPTFVEQRRMDQLFAGHRWPEGYAGSVHRLVLELLYGTGMRLAELLGLRVADADLHLGTLKVLGKRDKERIIPLTPLLVERIESCLAARTALFGPPSQDAPLLLGQTGKPLSRRGVQRLVSSYLGGVTTQRKKSPHVLRHTFATHLLEQGADLNAVKELLGHASLAATQVYTHNTVEKLRKIHAQAHPRGGGKGGQ